MHRFNENIGLPMDRKFQSRGPKHMVPTSVKKCPPNGKRLALFKVIIINHHKSCMINSNRDVIVTRPKSGVT